MTWQSMTEPVVVAVTTIGIALLTRPRTRGVLAGIAFGLAIPGDIVALASLYAFGSTLALTIAHLAIMKLRVSDPERRRPFRIPYGFHWGVATVPWPTLVAAVLSGLAFLSVLAFHNTARWVGLAWMAFGLTFYVVYRKVFEGTTLTKRVSVTERSVA